MNEELRKTIIPMVDKCIDVAYELGRYTLAKELGSVYNPNVKIEEIKEMLVKYIEILSVSPILKSKSDK